MEERVRCEVMKAVQRLRPASRELCLACKGGRLLCHRPYCPLLKRVNIQGPVEAGLKEHLFGPSPSIFVGWTGYPQVFAGPLTSLEDEGAARLDDPAQWYGASLDEIIRMRSLLVRSKVRVDVHRRPALVEKAQEIALSVQPVDTEVEFEKKPSYGFSFSPVSQPLGPSAVLKNLHVTENPQIPRKVDAVVSDELKASDAAFELYKSGYDVYYLTRILSSGTLGLESRRKLVPTRWSITATDDTLGRRLTDEIRNYPPVDDYLVYSNTYLDNHFEVLLMPRRWEFEQFEAWAPDTLWTAGYSEPAINRESEGYGGRTEYAAQEGGGYYASRLAVLEGLARMRRQAGVVVFREIYEGYVIPVGVWEVRENVRRAMAGAPSRFSTLGEALGAAAPRLKIPLEEYLGRSYLLGQRRLEEFA